MQATNPYRYVPIDTRFAPAPGSGENRLEAWLAEEASVRQQMDEGAGVGVLPVSQAVQRGGLAAMQGIVSGEFPHAHIGHTLSFMPLYVEAGIAVFQGEPKTDHLNPLGTVHGGWYATMLDSALGCAVHTLLPPGRAYTTAEISVRIVRALPLTVPRARAIGRVVHAGRQMATAEAQLVGPDGTLYAHGTTSCLVFEARP
jgi:uncharacterized protein (TIGR00369 family)